MLALIQPLQAHLSGVQTMRFAALVPDISGVAELAARSQQGPRRTTPVSLSAASGSGGPPVGLAASPY